MEIGTQTGPYRIESLLGRGGMAEVFKVWHQDLHRHEAMKVLPPAMTHDRSFVERFLGEARIVAGLQHPNIASIYGVSEADATQPYFTMELIHGGDLADLIESRGRFSLDEALLILRQIAAALDYAGGRGLIHRDIKPANIMLDEDGGVKVVDFGIARAQEEQNGTRMTQTGMIVGTPEYMSPEQAGSGAPVGPRTDQYSLGIIAYEMLCGEPPFRAQSDTGMMSVLMGHVRDAPRAPLEIASGLSANANNALLKALAKNPTDRFTSCGEFVRALGGEISVAAPSVKAAEPVKAAPKVGVKRGNPWPAVAIGAALFGGVAALALGMRGRDNIVEVAPESVQSASAAPAQNGGASAAVEPTAVALVTVPDLASMKEAQARDFLKSKALRADITTGKSDAIGASLVASQFPLAGAQVARNSAVRVKISTGPGAGGAAVQATEINEGETVSSPNSDDRARVAANYEAWLSAWRRMDLDGFMSFYSRDMVQKRAGKKAQGYGTQRSRLATLWGKVSYINLTSALPDIAASGQNIVMSAYQNYEDSNYWDEGTKRQVWTREGDDWKIIEESFSKKAGGKN